MRLVRVHVENFGTLSGYDAEFDPGLTVIKEDNGFGKSTLAAFIRVMFYGMPRAAGDLDKNDRKKYMPWQGGTFGGNLVFETGGRQYRIERTFGKVPKNDEFRLIDMSTGTESNRFGPGVGQELFGLDADSFAKSVYMPQNFGETELSTDNIQAKIGGLVDEAGDMQNFDNAVNTLKAKRSALIAYRGKTGAVWEAADRISRLRQDIDEMSERMSHVPEIKEKIAELEESARRDKEALSGLDKKIAEAEAGQKQRRILRENFEALRGEAKRSALRVEEEIEDRKRAIRRKAEALERLRESAEKIDEEIKRMQAEGVSEKEENEGTTKEAKTEGNNPGTKPQEPGIRKATAVIVTGIGLALASAALYLHFKAEYWLLPAAAGIIIIFAGIFKRNKALIKNELAMQKADEEKRYAELARRRAEDERRRAEDERRKAEENIRDCEEEIEGFRAQMRTLSERKEEARRRILDIEKKEQEAFAGETEDSFGQTERLRRERSGLAERLAAAQQGSARLEQQAETLEGLRVQIADKEDGLERLSAKKQEDTHTAELLDETIRLLDESKTAVSERYIEPVRRRFDHYAGRLVGFEGGEASVDTGLNVRVDRGGSLREIKYLSAGQADALMICMRLALIDAMFPGEKPFLILDDPFVNLDDKNTQNALDLLRRIADEHQVLYLVCNGSRC